MFPLALKEDDTLIHHLARWRSVTRMTPYPCGRFPSQDSVCGRKKPVGRRDAFCHDFIHLIEHGPLAGDRRVLSFGCQWDGKR